MRPVWTVVLALVVCLAAVGEARGQADASPAERMLLALVNQTRAQYGLRPLAWNSALARAAREHAERILRAGGERAGGRLEHQYPGEPDLLDRASRQGMRFSGVGENIARQALTPAELHAAWMATPVHRSNILSARWDSIGIGVVGSRGMLDAVEDFAASVPGLTSAEIELAVGEVLHRAGVRVAESSQRAREVCRSGRDPADALTITWDGPDPEHPPAAVLARVAEARAESAEIGACPGRPAEAGFTTYRVALLLR